MAVRRRKQWMILALLVSIGLLAFVLYFQWDSLRKMALEEIDEAFGQSIRFDNLQVSFFPHPRIELTNVLIEKHGISKVLFFQASRIRVDIEAMSSFLDKIVPTKFVLEQPHLVLRRESQDPWHFNKAISNTQAEKMIFQTILLANELLVVDGQVTVEDVSHPDNPRALSLKAIQFALSKNPGALGREMKLSGQIGNRSDVASLSLGGTWEQVQAPTVIAQDHSMSLLPSIAFDGTVDLVGFDPQQLSAFFQLNDIPLAQYGPIGIQGSFRIAPASQGYALTVSKFQAKSRALSLTGEGSVSGLLVDEPSTMFWTISSSAISLKRLVSLLPLRLLPSSLTRSLEEEKLRGVLTVESAHIAGSPHPDVGFSVVGDLRVEEGFLDLGPKWGMAQGVRGRAVLQHDLLKFFDVQGIYDSIPIQAGAGTIDLQNPHFPMDTVLEGEMSSRKLIDILRRVFDSEHTSPAWTSFKGVGGNGGITIRFNGPLASPDLVGFQDAKYQIRDGSFEFGTPAHLFTGVTGSVTFSPKHVGFETVAVNFGDSLGQVQGNITFGETNRFDALNVAGDIQVADLIQRLFPDSLPQETFSGTVHLNGMIVGLLEEPAIQGKVDLLDASLVFPGVLVKTAGVPGVFEFESQVRPRGTFAIDRMALSILPFQLLGRGAVNLVSPFGINASLSTGPVAWELLPEGMSVWSQAFQSGIFDLSVDVKGIGRDWQRWDKKGWVAVTDGVIDKQGFDHPIEDLYLRLKLSQHHIAVKRLDFRIEESTAQGRGMIRNWDRHPVAQLDIGAPQFDLDLLIPKGARSPIRDILEEVAATSEVDAQFRFTKAWYKALDFQDLSAQVRIANGVVDLAKVQGATESGRVNGRVVIRLPQGAPAAVNTHFALQDVSLETLERAFIQPKDLEARLVTGLVSAKGNVEGHGHDPLGIMHTIKGAVDVKVTDGYIQRGTVVPKVLALLNLPTVLRGKVDFQEKGFPFNHSTARFMIDHGVMTTENLVLSSPILTMTAAGEYRLPDHHVQLISAVSPFGPYSDLLKQIPLFGLLFDGDREAIDTAMFEVHGPIQSPEVAYLPGQSFKAGLTGLAKMAYYVLKNTVTLPATLLKDSPSEDASSDQTDSLDVVVPSDAKATGPRDRKQEPE